MPNPTQEQIDRVATFVEVGSEAMREPFFAIKDRHLSYTASQDWSRITMDVGDRFEFRSALVSFLRMWSSADPAHWQTVGEILMTTDLPSPLVHAAKYAETHVNWELDRTDLQQSMPGSRRQILRMGLSVFATPDKGEGSQLRRELDDYCREHGQATFEHGFRTSVQWIGYNLLEMWKGAARPALAVYAQLGLKPSFQVGVPFDVKRREQTGSGRVVHRRGTSEFAPEETYEERFNRILIRQEHRALGQILPRLEASPGELIRAVLRSVNFSGLLKELGGGFEITNLPKDKVGGGPRSDLETAGWITGSERYNVYSGNSVMTNEAGIAALDQGLVAFRDQVLNETP